MLNLLYTYVAKFILNVYKAVQVSMAFLVSYAHVSNILAGLCVQELVSPLFILRLYPGLYSSKSFNFNQLNLVLYPQYTGLITISNKFNKGLL